MPETACEFLRIFDIAVVVAVHGCVFALGIDIGPTDFDHGELVAADAPVEDLLCSCRPIQMPGIALLYGGYREGPLLLADGQRRLVLSLQFDPVGFVVGYDE